MTTEDLLLNNGFSKDVRSIVRSGHKCIHLIEDEALCYSGPDCLIHVSKKLGVRIPIY